MQHGRYFNVSVSPKKMMFHFLMFLFGVERFDVTNLFAVDDATSNMLCLRKINIASVAVACRRVGSQRVKRVPASKNKYYKNNICSEQKCC